MCDYCDEIERSQEIEDYEWWSQSRN
jgi:hypothetical protein